MLQTVLVKMARIKWFLYSLYTRFSKREYNINKMTVLHSMYWDEIYYRQHYEDLFQKKSLLPIDHYLQYGWKMGCNPSPFFDNDEYLRTFFFINMNPLVHYLKTGRFLTFAFVKNPFFSEEGAVREYWTNKKHNKKVIYTCIVNGYDDVIIPYVMNSDYDYICFTDDQKLIDKGTVGPWQFRPLLYKEGTFTHICRFHKIMAHIVLPDYDESIWIDGQVNILSSYIYDFTKETDFNFLTAPHGQNVSVFDEAKILIKSGIVKNTKILKEQIKLYKKAGFPRVHQTRETCVVYRKHHDEDVIHLMEQWWYWVNNYSQRDQISLPFVLWETGMEKNNPPLLRNPFVAYQDFLVVYHQKGRD